MSWRTAGIAGAVILSFAGIIVLAAWIKERSGVCSLRRYRNRHSVLEPNGVDAPRAPNEGGTPS